jgi:glycosyltransferase involved in cell wall biosynthesis
VRILFITHYFPPELGAPQTRLRETANGLRELGHDVRVMTGPPHYPDGRVRPGYSAVGLRREAIDGIDVLRLPMIPRPNGGFVDRVIDQGSLAIVACAALPVVRWAEVLLVESPPLFLGLTAAFHRLVSRRPYLFHVADPWPDFPIAMGALNHPVARRTAFAIERLAYRHAGLVTTVTVGLVRLLDRKPAATGRVRLLPNGVAIDRFDPTTDAAAARRRLGWPDDRLTLVYVGSVGLAQGLGTLIDAVAPLRGEGVSLRIVGEGFERQQLAARVRAEHLDHIHFDDPVAAAHVPPILAAADAVLVLLRRGSLYEDSLPTKLVEGLAAGRPVIVSAAGESARIVADAGAGYIADPEDPEALRDVIRQATIDPDRALKGQAGRAIAAEVFDRRIVVRTLAGYLEEVANLH